MEHLCGKQGWGTEGLKNKAGPFKKELSHSPCSHVASEVERAISLPHPPPAPGSGDLLIYPIMGLATN